MECAGLVDEMGLEVGSGGEEKRREVARRRWAILAEALLSQTVSQDCVSLRRISSLGLVSVSDTGQPHWYHYRGQGWTLKVRHVTEALSPDQLAGFNNTGNVCVWPSEEVLAHLVVNNSRLFRDKTVLELAGGMTCLAGLLVAKVAAPARVVLTDGNYTSVENVVEILAANQLAADPRLAVHCLRWGAHPILPPDLQPPTFDFILAGDCLFFEDSRPGLALLIQALLKNNGRAIITAPNRQNTLTKFVDLCTSLGLCVSLSHNYDPYVWQRHLTLSNDKYSLYDPDVHYPLLIIISKSSLPPLFTSTNVISTLSSI